MQMIHVAIHLCSSHVLEVLWSFEVEIYMFALACLAYNVLRHRYAQAPPLKDVRHSLPSASSSGSAAIQDCGCDAERARAIWRELDALQAPDVAALVSMVEVLVASGNIVEARNLANQVWKEGPLLRSPSAIAVYETLLHGFAKASQHHDVVAIYQEMKVRDVLMNTSSYNCILGSAARHGQMYQVHEVLADMQGAGTRAAPDRETYISILDGCYQAGDMESCVAVLGIMRDETAFRPDEKMYNSFLATCAQRRYRSGGLEVLAAMRQDGVMWSNYSLGSAIKVLGHARQLDEAFAMVETVPSASGFRPNIQVYTCLIQACLRAREVNRAFRLYNKIVESGLAVVDKKIYSAMVWGCLMGGATKEAAIVFRCAYHLPCDGGLSPAQGLPQGVDAECARRLLAEVEETSLAEAEELRAELAACGGIAWQSCSRTIAEEGCGLLSGRNRVVVQCRFFGTPGGCREGNKCRFQHTERD